MRWAAPASRIYGKVACVPRLRFHVGSWHLADNPSALTFVRYWSNNGHSSELSLDASVAIDPFRTDRDPLHVQLICANELRRQNFAAKQLVPPSALNEAESARTNFDPFAASTRPIELGLYGVGVWGTSLDLIR